MREWLIALRGSMSTIEAAKKLGISQQYYSYIENGKRQKRMDIQMCERIASAFGIEIYDVIKYESRENGQEVCLECLKKPDLDDEGKEKVEENEKIRINR